MSYQPPPEALLSPDERDRPGTDDHIRLMHPHGDAVTVTGYCVAGDVVAYIFATVEAHATLSAAYLELCASAGTQPEPLCEGTHAEVVLSVGDLPHGQRAGVAATVEAATRYGIPLVVLRVWRHYGRDCEAAEARSGCFLLRDPRDP